MVSLPAMSSASLWSRVKDLRAKCTPPALHVDMASPLREMQRRLSSTSQRMSGSFDRCRRESMQSVRKLRRNSMMPSFKMPTTRPMDSNDIDDFELRDVLGSGTFGVVRLARHRATGRAVAIKRIDMDVIRECHYEATIFREQNVHLRLDHPLVCRLHTTFQDVNAVYLVMEYCPGGELYGLVYPEEEDQVDEDATEQDREQEQEVSPLSESGLCPTESESEGDEASSTSPPPHVAVSGLAMGKGGCAVDKDALPQKNAGNANDRAKRALRNRFGGLEEEHVAFYMACVLLSMQYLHMQDVLYRDLKLENVVLDAQGYPKLIDFGLAKPDASQGEPSTRMVGSLDYMAPEVVQREPYGYAVDIWTFGVLLYEMLVGTTPFLDADMREQRRRICEDEVTFPEGFEEEHPNACALIRHLLQKDPTQRPGTFAEVRESALFQHYFPSYKAWKALENKRVRAPFVPVLESPFDRSLFPSAQDEDEDEEYAEDDETTYTDEM